MCPQLQQTKMRARESDRTSDVSDWKKTASWWPQFMQLAFWLRGRVGSSATAAGTVARTFPSSLVSELR